MARYRLLETGVFDTTTGQSIPEDDGNRHWLAYQEWLAAGNTPDPELPPPARTEDEVTDLITDVTDPMKKVVFEAIYELVTRVVTLEGNTPPTKAQFRTWVKSKLSG